MTELPIQLATGGIFAVLTIREVLSFLAKRNGHAAGVEDAARRIALENAVIEIGKNCGEQTGIFRELHRDIIEMRRENNETHERIVRALSEKPR